MKIYNDIFFVIDSENYDQNKKDLFYGYKWFEDEGFWLEVKHRPTKIHIYSSYISPIIVIYEKDDYWAISNSCYCLVNYLKENDINLEINEEYLKYEALKTGAFNFKYFNDILLYKELKINNYDEEVDIVDGKLSLVKKEFKFFEKDINYNLDTLWKWYERYYNLLVNKNHIYFGLSGGLDSRLLWYSFIRPNQNEVIINSYHNKSNADNYFDSELAGKVYKYYTGKDLISTDLDHTKNIKSLDLMELNDDHFETVKRFFLGSCYNPPKLLVKADECFAVQGIGTNIYRYEFQADWFINGIIRRFWASRSIARYYVLKNTYIYPYLDSLLLNLDTKETDYLHTILYSLFAKDLLSNGIPFYTHPKRGKFYFQEWKKDLFEKFSKIYKY